jgi:endonuclease/exonuclease/phosphatase family metal-dependent hydrolase
LPGKPVRLATWNLEHLAARNGEGCRPRTDADYDALRRHADELGADVIALQEVENAQAAARVFPGDRWTVVMSARPGSAREGFCRGTAGPKILKQDVGFAIRKGIRFRRNSDLAALGLGNPDLRWGVDITLDLTKPIRLLAVHLKSGCNTKRDISDRDCPVLFSQAPVLEGWIDARARAGEDFAVMGDWNRRTALPGDEFLSIVSDNDPSSGSLVFANSGRRATCVKRYADFIDHIAVGRDTAPRLQPGSFVEYTYGVPENQHPADHCPNSVAISRR